MRVWLETNRFVLVLVLVLLYGFKFSVLSKAFNGKEVFSVT